MNVRFVMTALALLSAGAPDASAQCMRLVPEKHSGDLAIDGPGAFGPLHNTVSLGCLHFTDVVGAGRNTKAILLDETGAEFRVGVGDYVGENSGKVLEITKKRLTIIQVVVNADNEFTEVKRFLFLVHKM